MSEPVTEPTVPQDSRANIEKASEGYHLYTNIENETVRYAPKPIKDNYVLHVLLFLATIATTTLAGAELIVGRSFFLGNLLHMQGVPEMSWADYAQGLPYSVCFLLFLSFHEFGHYFTAVYHKVRTSLPYYIPIFIPLIFNIGTLGAVIRLRQQPRTTAQFFDIGIAGPLAGFIISVIVLIYGFATLPEKEYIYQIHPEYKLEYGHVPNFNEQLEHESGNEVGNFAVGKSLLFWILEKTVADPARMPSAFEVMHYPFLFVGFITLFFTALNLLPIGQLDGGHVMYGLLGRKWAGWISRAIVVFLVTYAGIALKGIGTDLNGMVIVVLYYLLLALTARKVMGTKKIWRVFALIAAVIVTIYIIQTYFPFIKGSMVWLLFVFMSVTFVGLDHPVAQEEKPISLRRKILGWTAFVIFILCFSPEPLYIPEKSGEPTLFTQRTK